MKAGINRRQFMQKSLVGAAAAPLVTHVLGHEAEAFTQAVSPNDRIQVGIIGVGARVQSGVLDAALAVPGVEVIGVCDAYKGRVPARILISSKLRRSNHTCCRQCVFMLLTARAEM